MNTRFTKRCFSLFLVLCLLLVFCAACSGGNDVATKPSTDKADESIRLKPAESYEAIYQSLKTLSDSNKEVRTLADTTESSASSQSIAKEAAMEDSGAGAAPSYSETNVQVQGIDEADIVKTDGNNIYVLKNNRLFIFSADGGKTEQLSETLVGQDWEETESDDHGFSYSYDNAYELYLSGNRLAVLSNYGSYSDSDSDALNKDLVRIRIFDVSDPTSPALLQTLGQDGGYCDSRLLDGVLYVVSTYTVYTEIDEDTPASYTPCLYRGTDCMPLPYDGIYLPSDISSECYTVLVSYRLEDGTQIADTAVMADASTLYMNHDNLYLFHRVYEETASEPYQKDQYSVVDYTTASSTDIYRFSIADGAITLAATGNVDGYLINQFAADEYDGVLRVVTTADAANFSIYTDETHNWDNYEWKDSTSSNALYTLDSDLKPLGSITDLAKDESVYSVRFADEIVYFVTFYQVDPLFAVDLADPAAPKLLDSLKITGFSEYLHPYGDGLLFGLGMEADEETGTTDSMKLTMFDIQDPANVSVQNSIQINTDWSVALYNHKAILVSAAQNLIAFPTEDGYQIYGYHETDGFYLQADIAFDSGYWSRCYDARGLYIDDMIYIVGDTTLFVLSMTDFTTVAQLSYNS